MTLAPFLIVKIAKLASWIDMRAIPPGARVAMAEAVVELVAGLQTFAGNRLLGPYIFEKRCRLVKPSSDFLVPVSPPVGFLTEIFAFS